MKKLFASVSALMLTLGLAVMPVAAQSTPDAGQSATEAIGVESAYTRMYQAEGTDTDVLLKMVGGIKFSDTEIISTGLSDFACGFVGGFTGATSTQTCEDLEADGWTIEERDDIGESAVEATGTGSLSGSDVPMTMLFVLEGDYVFQIGNIGAAEAGSADEMAQFMVDAEPSDAPVEFDASGTSTGGFFDMLPAEDDALLEGYAVVQDLEQIAPSDATPEASPSN